MSMQASRIHFHIGSQTTGSSDIRAVTFQQALGIGDSFPVVVSRQRHEDFFFGVIHNALKYVPDIAIVHEPQ
jgi:hypothetical protein